jgi:hypothetical protein
VRTRYTWGNVALLAVGTAVCAAMIPYVGWVVAATHAPAGGKRLCEDLDVLTAVLALPAFALGWRWPRVSAYTMWTLVLFLVLFAAIAGELLPMSIPILVLGGVSGLASWVEAQSEDRGTKGPTGQGAGAGK